MLPMPSESEGERRQKSASPSMPENVRHRQVTGKQVSTRTDW
jgi:hypothetical protein